MPTPTYTPLATVTLGSSAASVTFSSIPATYRDLILVGQFTGSSAAAALNLRFNSDTGNYTGVQAFFSGAVGSNTTTSQTLSAIYGANITFATANIMDYSATDKHKTTLTRSGNVGNSEVAMAAFRWASTAAVTTIGLVPAAGTISAGSTFNLYGIVA
jgi:hypothetical protein